MRRRGGLVTQPRSKPSLVGGAPVKDMSWVPTGPYSLGSADFYPEEQPVRFVELDGFWMDAHPVTNAEFRRFVRATGHVTVAESAPDAADFPDADPAMLVPGSLVFRQPAGPVPLQDWRAWWAWTPGADWRHPRGPGSTLQGLERHPVVHVAFTDARAYARRAAKDLATEAEWEAAARGGLVPAQRLRALRHDRQRVGVDGGLLLRGPHRAPGRVLLPPQQPAGGRARGPGRDGARRAHPAPGDQRRVIPVLAHLLPPLPAGLPAYRYPVGRIPRSIPERVMLLQVSASYRPRNDDPDLGSGRTTGVHAVRYLPDGAESRIGGVTLEEQIGQGATGRVFRGVTDGGGVVAVKLLRDELAEDPMVLGRLVQEFKVLRDLHGRYIVGAQRLVMEGDHVALIMDFVGGGDVRQLLTRRKNLPPARATRVIAEVLMGLVTAHDAGVIHRDVKPENALLTQDGEIRLTDFGIARVLEGPTTTRGTGLIGSPSYMAPELNRRLPVTSAVDVYGAGCMYYELLTGATPFEGGAAASVLLRHLREKPRRPPGAPDSVWSILRQMLDKVPERRPTAREALESALGIAESLADLPPLPLRGQALDDKRRNSFVVTSPLVDDGEHPDNQTVVRTRRSIPLGRSSTAEKPKRSRRARMMMLAAAAAILGLVGTGTALAVALRPSGDVAARAAPTVGPHAPIPRRTPPPSTGAAAPVPATPAAASSSGPAGQDTAATGERGSTSSAQRSAAPVPVPAVPSVVITRPTSPVLPSAPGSMIARTAGSTATVSWIPPTNGAAITGYVVSRDGTDSVGLGPWSGSISPSATSTTFTRLVPGRTYVLSVRAVDAAGAGPPATATVTLPLAVTAPSTPTGLQVSIAGAGATIVWTPPADTGGAPITGYRVSRDGTDAVGLGVYGTTLSPSATSFTFTRLMSGGTYDLSVQAINDAGASTPVTVVARIP